MEEIKLPIGFLASGIHCGIKEKSEKRDFGIVFSEIPGSCAGVFTKNKVKAVPVIITMERVKNGIAQAIVANSGSANACTGERGIKDALLISQKVSKFLNIPEEYILLASTGIIGKPLPIEKIVPKIPLAIENLSSKGGLAFQEAIMTTDKRPKFINKTIFVDNREITFTGIAKGSGMIHPQLATMLSFILTDISISSFLLDKALKEVVEETFNMISVDRDTSTNDTVLIIANGKAKNNEIIDENENYEIFKNTLKEVCIYLAKEIAKDGEGATKLIEVEVINASTKESARALAKSVVSSNLVKCAIYGQDANWGRILCALGYADSDFDPFKVDIYIGEILIVKNGNGIDFEEKEVSNLLSRNFVKIKIDLKSGDYCATAWGCDLTEEYIRINAKYRT
ncbi:MAG: bifunctional glutamate N-acetyltransferase/amino-acid acetyltransferase ArgJ [Dictyoglomus sp.]|nr:bifunctional glutamate N-acetyltransferase/amino-acid acetyltransferase ArgJ [Dictyoglomus sp.]MCX7941579.1 bifunctional glutamate N-acetyltransferase/amino-acid acetyltransferase ArgJ [Dictyoglomaceae bacterium]MDW8187802.1 bifunctional glutamate N-acetyltransferase/amino-acid acetyltransferase ArgJ [Dictyoglomus sp.]